MSILDRFIDAMDAASRRLEAEAALVRARTAERTALMRAFTAGAVAGVKHYNAAPAPEVVSRKVFADFERYVSRPPASGEG